MLINVCAEIQNEFRIRTFPSPQFVAWEAVYRRRIKIHSKTAVSDISTEISTES